MEPIYAWEASGEHALSPPNISRAVRVKEAPQGCTVGIIISE